MNNSSKTSKWGRRSALRALARLGEADGITLVEVLVTCVMVGLIGMTLVGLDAAGQTSADQRRRSEAVQIAQQDQERIKGLSADQIATLDQTRTVTVDGVPYTVRSQGAFISSSSAAASCSTSGAAADYAKVISTVKWSSNTRSDIVEQSIISPRAGGGVIADVNDQTGAPLPGAAVSLAGTDQNTGSVRRRGGSDADGCVIFGALLVGDYSVTAARSGYVDPQGSSAPSNPITATAGNSSTSIFSLGLAGRISGTFSTVTTTGQTAVTGQKTPSMSWNNNGMLTAGLNDPATLSTSLQSATNIYPFTTGTSVYTKNYTVWAGSCSTDTPPLSANQSFATVAPGTNPASVAVLEPAMALQVSLKTSSSSTVRVVPDIVKLTDSCGETWTISGTDLDSSGATSALGVLKYPGQPYTSSYTVCVQDQASSTNYKATTTTSNTDFTKATVKAITIDATNTSNKGTC